MEKLKREIIIPDSHDHWLNLKTRDISSTEVSALFGLSKYITEYELYFRKKDGIAINIEPAERMRWGTRLESAIARGVAEDKGWIVRPMKEYIRLTDLRMSASFDYCLQSNDGQDFAILEIKNVDGLIYKNEWIEHEDGTFEAPPGIELQVQMQMLTSGLSIAYIAALIGGNRVCLIQRERDDAICEKLITACAIFWERIANGIPPPPNFERDADFISSLYQSVEPGTVMDAYGDHEIEMLVKKYKESAELAKQYEAQKQAAKAELLMRVGDHEKVKGDGFSISCGIIGPATVSYERASYRDFRCFTKKQKE